MHRRSFVLLLCIGWALTIKLDKFINTAEINTNHGYIIGFFTFTGTGIAELAYSIYPLNNDTNLKLSIFPLAYDVCANLNRIQRFYNEMRCVEFYHRSIHTVNIIKLNDKVPLGRFSGGFSVVVVLSNKYVCPPNVRRLDIDESNSASQIRLTVDLLNPDEDNQFSKHMSATDRGTERIVGFILAVCVLLILWAVFCVRSNINVDTPLMLLIQKLICALLAIYIIIFSFLLLIYNKLSETGIMYNNVELVTELLALICRYIQLYIVISWTLSSHRNSGKNNISKIIGSYAALHTIFLGSHYLLLDTEYMAYSCSVVWDCENHIFSLGFGNGFHSNTTYFGLLSIIINWITGLGSSMFVLHLLKLGLGISEYSVRRTYISVFCSTSILWFLSYPTIWLLSSLITDYYQYQFVLFVGSVVQLCPIPAILRVTRLTPVQIESSLPKSVVIFD